MIIWPCMITDSLWIKPTETSNSNVIGITTLRVSGSLSAHHQEFLAVHRLWYVLCSCDDRLPPGSGWNILLLVENGHITNKIGIRCICWFYSQRLLYVTYCTDTRVGTLIVATIYLQLIQNRYMIRSFTVLQCSHQHCLQPVASDVEVVKYFWQRLLCW